LVITRDHGSFEGGHLVEMNPTDLPDPSKPIFRNQTMGKPNLEVKTTIISFSVYIYIYIYSPYVACKRALLRLHGLAQALWGQSSLVTTPRVVHPSIRHGTSC